MSGSVGDIQVCVVALKRAFGKGERGGLGSAEPMSHGRKKGKGGGAKLVALCEENGVSTWSGAVLARGS